jgi:hypothetical protein
MSDNHPLDINIFTVKSISLTNPAPGANFSYTCPANTRMEIISVFLTLTTDATVASRLVLIHGHDGTSNIQVAEATLVQVNSSSCSYSASSAGGSLRTTATDSIYCLILPSPLILNPGEFLRSTVLAIQATDQISAITIRAKMWANPY